MNKIKLFILIGLFFAFPVQGVFAVAPYTGSPSYGSYAECTGNYTCYPEIFTTRYLYNDTSTAVMVPYCNTTYKTPTTANNAPLTPVFNPAAGVLSGNIKGFTGISDTCGVRRFGWNGSTWAVQPSGVNNLWTGQYFNLSVTSTINVLAGDTGAVNAGYGIAGNSVTVNQVLYSAEYVGPPVASMDSYLASQSAQLAYLNLSGDTGTTSASMRCTIKLVSDCHPSGTDFANFRSPSSVATIILEALAPRTDTLDSGGGFYYGYGFTSTSHEWQADNVAVPYEPGYSCSYPFSTQCYDVLDPNRTLIVDTMATGSASIAYVSSSEGGVNMGGQYIAPNPLTDPISWLMFQIKKMMSDFFIPHFATQDFRYSDIYNLLSTKAPFAYFISATSVNTAAVSDPGFSFTIGTSVQASSVPHTISYSPVSEVTTWISTFKDFVATLLWITFILYLIFIPRRLMAAI